MIPEATSLVARGLTGRVLFLLGALLKFEAKFGLSTDMKKDECVLTAAVPHLQNHAQTTSNNTISTEAFTNDGSPGP